MLLLATQCATASARLLRRPLVGGVAAHALARGGAAGQRAFLSGAATGSAGAAKKKYLNDPSLRVRVVPMFSDNYGASRVVGRLASVVGRGCRGLVSEPDLPGQGMSWWTR